MSLNSFGGFFTYIKYFLTGNSENIIKLKELKSLYRIFKHAKYKYITKDKKITNLFLQKMYLSYTNINDYKSILDATIFSKDDKKALLYLNHFIESYLNEDIKVKKEKFTKETMWNRIMEAENATKSIKEIEDEFIMYKKFFSKENLPSIEPEYYLLYKLNSLSTFNFELFFSKFDPEYVGPGTPNYNPVLGDEIFAELEDFYFLISSLPPKIDLSNAFEKLYMKGQNDFKILAKKSQNAVNKIYKMLQDDLSPQIILNLCRFIKEDSKFNIQIQQKLFSILEKYKKEITDRFLRNKEYVLEKYSEKSLQHDIHSLFQGKILLKIEGYDEDIRKEIEGNNFDQISGIQAIRITKTFIHEIYEKNIKEIINNLILEAFFNEKDYQSQFSNLFFAANELKDMIAEYEERLSGTGKFSFNHLLMLLRNYKSGSKVGENKVAMQIELINETIRHCNEKCADILYKLATCIYTILQDYKNQKPAYITNIKTIKGSQNKEFISQLVNTYNDIAKYIKLIKNFIVVKNAPKKEVL